jgi:carbonic anhydrase
VQRRRRGVDVVLDRAALGVRGRARAPAWGELSDDFAACSDGLAQSPVDLGSATPSDRLDLTVDYESGPVTIADNGHTVQATVADGDHGITVEGTAFELVQMHFHTPSEHTIDGEFAEAEAHFVHRSAEGELAVIGVMLIEGDEPNASWGAYTDAAGGGEGVAVDATLDWPSLLPDDLTTLRYSGSLTTPPCTEGVRWMVMDEPVALAADQLAALAAVHEGNHRPVQPLNGREVLADIPAD